MNAVVERGMVTPTSAAVLRGASAVNEVRDLLDQLSKVDALSGRECKDSNAFAVHIGITTAEVLEVIARRRKAVVNLLENKGIRIAPEPDFSPASSDDA